MLYIHDCHTFAGNGSPIGQDDPSSHCDLPVFCQISNTIQIYFEENQVSIWTESRWCLEIYFATRDSLVLSIVCSGSQRSSSSSWCIWRCSCGRARDCSCLLVMDGEDGFWWCSKKICVFDHSTAKHEGLKDYTVSNSPKSFLALPPQYILQILDCYVSVSSWY